MIGVVGAGGAVGTVAAAQLVAAGYPLRAGGRMPERIERPAGRHPAESVRVDIDDPDSLSAFCDGCAVVLNCAGPAARIGARVAAAAAAAGAHYVDAAGDDELHASVRDVHRGRVAIVSAGLSPGLSELLPRYLAATAPAPPRRLTVWHGSRDRFAPAAAVDYLAATTGDFGVAGGAWRDARVVAGSATRTGVRVPFFPDPLTLFAYLSTAAAQVAHDLGLSELEWFNGFAGKHTTQALAESTQDGAEAVERLIRASELDLFGSQPYQIMLLRAEDDRGARCGLVVRGRGASAITGAFAASAVDQVMRGRIPAGVHHAGFVLDPAETMTALLASGALVSLVPIDGDPCADDATEDGAL